MGRGWVEAQRVRHDLGARLTSRANDPYSGGAARLGDRWRTRRGETREWCEGVVWTRTFS